MRRLLAFLVVLLGWAGGQGCLADPVPAPDRLLVVGTKEAPPFSIKDADGGWQGISIDLWRQIAADLGVRFELRETDMRGLLEGVADGTLDAAVAAVTITPEREQAFDFSHPFHTTGLSIAVPAARGSSWLAVLGGLLSLDFLEVIGALACLLLAVGVLVWWLERRRNPAQFGGGPVRGISSGFWWSAVTMTTVGYGDKAPVTLGGRMLAVVWMFAGVIVISSFTAAIAAALTVNRLDSPVQGPADLPKVRVGTVRDSTSEAYLETHRIGYRGYDSALAGLEAVAAGRLDAFVYDAPLMRYLARTELAGRLQVLPNTFLRQDYGIALPPASPLRETVNRALLRHIREPAWQDILYRYLGG